MPPQQPGNQPNLDFIMNSNAPSAKKSLLPAGNSTKQRIAIVAIIGGILIGFLIVMMLILGSGGDNKQSMLKIAQAQVELARVATLANDSTDQSVRNFAVNTKLTIASDTQALLGTLGENGIGFKDKDLVLGQNPETDQALATAKAAANFDTVLRTTLIEQLIAYQASLKETYDASSNTAIKEKLSQIYANVEPLLKQGQPQTAATP